MHLPWYAYAFAFISTKFHWFAAKIPPLSSVSRLVSLAIPRKNKLGSDSYSEYRLAA